MEQTKKRRNSILKKPQQFDDETTTDVTTKIKRRISFSGKKSVKEFIAGEEEATIWGTSYEESADGLKGNTTESGVVDVNEKRIVLRSRRVIVEPNRETKRRSKVKVHVAENDKENIFVPMPEELPPVEVKPPPPREEVAVKDEWPVKPVSVTSAGEDVKVLCVAEPSVCSSTFDFINYSAMINKSINIEQSVDVSLDENEIEMFKFRVPVRSTEPRLTDVSPNLSECSARDGSSPNIFSNSILMSEDDVKLLKQLKGNKHVKGSDEKRMTHASVKPTEGTIMEVTEMEEQVAEDAVKKRPTMHMNQSMSVSLCEGQGKQRMTISTTVGMDVDGRIEMHNPARRHTLHMDQSMDVSRCAEPKSLKRKTGPKALEKTEASMCMSVVGYNETTMEPQTLDINSPMRKKPMHNATSNPMEISAIGNCLNATSKPMDMTTVAAVPQKEPIRRHTIHFDAATMEESLVVDELQQPAEASRQTIRDRMVEDALCEEVGADISMELSVVNDSVACKDARTVWSSEETSKKNRQTIHFVEEVQMDFTMNTTKKRQSVINPVDIVEDSPRAVKSAQQKTDTQVSGSRHTIYTAADIAEDSPPTNQRPVQSKSRASLYTPADIIEDSMTESESRHGAVKGKEPAKLRQSVYTPTDMVEDSPGHPKTTAARRQTITCPVDMIDEPAAPKPNSKQRQSVYTAADMVQDSPQQAVAKSEQQESQAHRISGKIRESIYTPLDIEPDSPVTRHAPQMNRKSIYGISDMIQVPPITLKPSQIPKMSTRPRQSVCIPVDIVEDNSKCPDSHQTDDSSVITKPACDQKLVRHQTVDSADIIEETSPPAQLNEGSSKPSQPSTSKVIVKRVNLQQGLIGNQATLRILQKQQAKIKATPVEAPAEECAMEMPIVEERPKSTYRQLNDELLRGETKAFADERSKKMSLLDRIAMQPAEEFKFDSFMDKSTGFGFPLQPARNSMRDYTVELSMKKFTNGRMDFTVELSPRKLTEAPARRPSEGRVAEKPVDGMELDKEFVRTSSKRQTIHFDKNNDLDVSTNLEDQAGDGGVIKRRTMTSNALGEDAMDFSVAEGKSVSSSQSLKNRQTIHFNQNNDIEEILIEHSQAPAKKLHDDSTMELSMRETGATKKTNNIDDDTMELSTSIGFKSQYLHSQPPRANSLRRQTVHCNEDLEVDEGEDVQFKIPHKDLRAAQATVTRCRDDDTMELSTSIANKSQIPHSDPLSELRANSLRRQTVHCNEDLEVEDVNQEPVLPSNQQIPCLENDLDGVDGQFKTSQQGPRAAQLTVTRCRDDDTMELSTSIAYNSHLPHSGPLSKFRANSLRRQTVHCNEDLELDEVNLEHSLPSNRQTKLEQTHIQQSLKSNQTMTSNKNGEDTMDLSTSIGFQPQLQTSQPSREVKTNPPTRQTIFNQSLDLEEGNQGPKEDRLNPTSLQQSFKASSHLASMNKQDDTMELSTSIVLPSAPPTNHKHPVSSAASSKRQTIHFNQDLEVEEVKVQQVDKKSEPQRQTILFQQDNDLQKSTAGKGGYDFAGDMSMCTETVDTSKILPKPRRMTIVENQAIKLEESPQMLPTRKSSFSRTLNFNEIQTKSDMHDQTATKSRIIRSTSVSDRDSPLYYYNPRSKTQETTSEFDRSLAEYLKAEAAATNSQDMSMDVVADLPQSPKVTEQPQPRRQTTHQLADILEESGMQPLQKLSSREASRYVAEDEPDRVCEESGIINSNLDFVRQRLDAKHLQEETRLNTLSNGIHPQPSENIQRSMFGPNKRQTILQPEPMMEESEDTMEMDEIPKARTQPTETGRRTIHFTNENAVDETFFDENLTKPLTDVQKKRQTLFFSDSEHCNDMEVSVSVNSPFKAIGRSKAAQSMKEILLESNKLFSQTKLPKPSTFESKRTTLYFTGTANSMDVTAAGNEMECDSPKRVRDLECTPTKSPLGKSRIPQLIGSAKKLQSMKKSIEFIEQELPNLGTSCANRKTTGSSHDEVLGNITSQCTANFLEAFTSVEIPAQPSRRTTTHEPRELQESFETIEIPRRATAFQRNETLHLSANEVDHADVSQKSYYKFEDVPITISDVSTFFAQNPLPSAKQTFSPNTTETLCNLDVNRFQEDSQQPKSSDSEDTHYNVDNFKKRYVELTCDSFALGSKDDIDKTHLSLVNTLDEASEVVHSECQQQSAVGCSSAVPKESSPPPPLEISQALPAEVSLAPPAQEPTKTNSSVCRKCIRHKQSVALEDTTFSSFVLDQPPEYTIDWNALRVLASKPKIRDVGRLWQQRLEDCHNFVVSDGLSSMSLEDENSADKFLANLDKEVELASKLRRSQRKEYKPQVSFVHRIRKDMRSKKSNWILNEILLNLNILKFSHTRIRTFAIVINFTPKDPRGVEVTFNDIQIVPNMMHSRQWKPFEYVLHYHLMIELPFDLRKLCATSENPFDLLDHVEAVTQDVLKLVMSMLLLVYTSPASLIRDPSGSLYIRKYVRMKTPQYDVKRIEFHIEVQNIKKLSFESIKTPPLYEFDEKIQLLPVGLDFLRIFLADPMRYIKSS